MNQTFKAVGLGCRAMLIAVVSVGGQVLASPSAAPIDAIALQPDGSQFVVRQIGDGTSVWQETQDGYTVVQNAAGQWVYAVPSVTTQKSLGVNNVAASGYVVGRDDNVRSSLPKHMAMLTASTEDQRQHERHNSSLAKSVSGSNPIVSTTGSGSLLVILAYYDDALSAPNCTACATTHASVFQQTVFGSGRHSVADYVHEVSHGQMSVLPARETNGTVDDGIVGWLRLGATTPQGTVTTTSAFKSNRVAADAITAAMSYVDFTSYDSNHDGFVTADELSILVVLAGYESSYGRNANGLALSSDTSSPRVWGQSRSFSSVAAPTQSANGKTVTVDTRGQGMTYSIIGELHGDHPATMGIMTHELGHSMFDLPDLYDISGASNGVGVWSLMGYGSWGKRAFPTDVYPGETPVVLDAWSRIALGWVTPQIPTSGTVVSVTAASNSNDTVYLLPTAHTNEYFLVENRRPDGYDAGLYYLLFSSDFGGLAVWHIDDNVGTAGMNDDNADKTHKRVDLVAAVGDTDIDARQSYGRTTNLYYEGNVVAFNDQTSPSAKLYSGTDSGAAISSASIPAVTMSFRAVYATDASTTSTISSTVNSTTSSQDQIASNSAAGGGGAWSLAWLMMLVVRAGLRRRVLA